MIPVSVNDGLNLMCAGGFNCNDYQGIVAPTAKVLRLSALMRCDPTHFPEMNVTFPKSSMNI